MQVVMAFVHLAVFLIVPAALIWGVLKLHDLWDAENSFVGSRGDDVLRESHEDVRDTLR